MTRYEWDMNTRYRQRGSADGERRQWLAKWNGQVAFVLRDSLPAVVDIGPGSPTGTVTGGGQFPTKPTRMPSRLDWISRIWAIHLKPDGSRPVGEKEEFVQSPLPVTDAIIGDEAPFISPSVAEALGGLYRVTYIWTRATAPSPHIRIKVLMRGRLAEAMRHSMKKDPKHKGSPAISRQRDHPLATPPDSP